LARDMFKVSTFYDMQTNKIRKAAHVYRKKKDKKCIKSGIMRGN